MNWYAGVKDYVLNEVISDIGKGLTYAIQYPLCAYGVGEAINTYKDYRNSRKGSESIPKYIGRLARESPFELAGTIMTLAPYCIANYFISYGE